MKLETNLSAKLNMTFMEDKPSHTKYLNRKEKDIANLHDEWT